MTTTHRKYLWAASLAVALAMGSACTTASDGARPIPIEFPIVLRGRAPGYERDAAVERIAEGADLPAILQTYRLEQTNTRHLVEHPSLNAQWWLIVPPAQPSGGYRLRVTLDNRNADACLVPPRGPATAAFVKSAYLVGLPRNVDMLRWHAECPHVQATPPDVDKDTRTGSWPVSHAFIDRDGSTLRSQARP